MNVKEQKTLQGYKTTPETCANCVNFRFREYHYADFVEGKRIYRVEVPGKGPAQIHHSGGREFFNFFTDTYRCGIGGFAVNKLATCKLWAQARP